MENFQPWNAFLGGKNKGTSLHLHFFCMFLGHAEVVRVLLEANANVEDHNENGHTPLMEAASAGHVEVAKILLEYGAGINTHSNEVSFYFFFFKKNWMFKIISNASIFVFGWISNITCNQKSKEGATVEDPVPR